MAFNDIGKFGIKIKMNEESEVFTEVSRGVCFMEADFSDRSEIRKFIDGDRAVPMSDRVVITLEFIRDMDDPCQEFLLDAANCGRRVEVICGGAGDERRFNALALVEKISKGDIWGIKYRLKLCS
ncbi:MAG: hypothetical protein K2N72_10750 [Oscillospiraceae bacterium]|nr:hypothetical protein [Oscillospiraceae bacterium]